MALAEGWYKQMPVADPERHELLVQRLVGAPQPVAVPDGGERVLIGDDDVEFTRLGRLPRTGDCLRVSSLQPTVVTSTPF